MKMANKYIMEATTASVTNSILCKFISKHVLLEIIPKFTDKSTFFLAIIHIF